MASEEQKFTSEFKAKVALEALAQQKKNLDRVSDKYDVPVSYILTWVTQLEKNAVDLFSTPGIPEAKESEQPEEKEVDLQVSDSKVAHSLDYGVMEDKLNYKKLAFWAGLGIVLFLIFVQGLMEMYQYNVQAAQNNTEAQNQYYESAQMKEKAKETLSSFGVVDLDKGIYRIPIDSAINEIAVGSE